MDFEWIVVDDGSKDDTEEVISKFKAEKLFPITYIKQENGGKHRAHNKAVSVANGIFTICLDSDDALTENAVSRIKEIWSLNNDFQFAGILALRGDFVTKKALSPRIPNKLCVSTLFDLYHRYNFSGDTALFYVSKILKEFPFREFSDERFLSEISSYYIIDNVKPLLLVDEILYLCEYLADGLTAKFLKLLKNNPKGSAYSYYISFVNSRKIRHKLKYGIIFNAYMGLVKDKNELNPKSKSLVILATYLPGILYRVLRINKI
jgi:glycosyltransferase involved in cell wall biosynthesis